MSLTLSDWFYEGILMDGGLLSIDPVYFTITGGRERWLYRVARKHAGGDRGGGLRHLAAYSVREIGRGRHLSPLQIRNAGHRPAQ
jgi:plasmid replication initiation protein